MWTWCGRGACPGERSGTGGVPSDGQARVNGGGGASREPREGVAAGRAPPAPVEWGSTPGPRPRPLWVTTTKERGPGTPTPPCGGATARPP
eukprot:CAMPEP_0174381800 /NCGR_PEP_ID=MMETSP0811_2-20130205/124237_1 /TAXON_ID=73025 ORGANISM="Eutreptiella gymnastica-like, Strain CCMP1594" /NCGR_SAMPLE_ID=MMETSP0811_2 /ASSEMBLY_ACC=CAM_ASM_000667 /LENGTH=90 /DNA_ID=CAMNT_0015535039 /DNA_START=986 /DNA_END=1254 /DNA_ORIENTATION=+